MKTTTARNHPHNAAAADYKAAVDQAHDVMLEMSNLVDTTYRLCFGTIEGTDARKDAVAAYKAVQDAYRAFHAARAVVIMVKGNAEDRSETLAKVEAPKATVQDVCDLAMKRSTARFNRRQEIEAYKTAKANGTLPSAKQPNAIPEVGGEEMPNA